MAAKLAPEQFEVIPMGEGFTWESDNLEKDKATAQRALGDRQREVAVRRFPTRHPG